jgi:hypothetical protein
MLAISAGLLAAATLAEWVLGLDIGIDRLLFAPAPLDRGLPAAGRMAAPVAAAYLVLALSVGFHHTAIRFSQVAAETAVAISVTIAAGAAYGATTLFSAGGNATAVPAMVILLSLSFGAVTLHPEIRIVRWLRDPGAAGQFVRPMVRLVPLIAVVALISVRLDEIGLVSDPFAAAGMVIALGFLVSSGLAPPANS